VFQAAAITAGASAAESSTTPPFRNAIANREKSSALVNTPPFAQKRASSANGRTTASGVGGRSVVPCASGYVVEETSGINAAV
jgi:hypothetical protein